jgi:hypothetical protein
VARFRRRNESVAKADESLFDNWEGERMLFELSDKSQKFHDSSLFVRITLARNSLIAQNAVNAKAIAFRGVLDACLFTSSRKRFEQRAGS